MLRSEPPWPLSITVSAARDRVTVAYDNGTSHDLPAEYLRVETPSAERKGHGRRMVVGGKAGVLVNAIEPVGRYAVRIVFSDGHDSGLYPFDTLHSLGEEQPARWAAYERELAAVNLDRTTPGIAPAPTSG